MSSSTSISKTTRTAYSTEKHSSSSKKVSNHSITNYTLSKRLNLLSLHSMISVICLKMELTAIHTATIPFQKKKKKELKKNKSMKIISMMNMNLMVVSIILMTMMIYTFEQHKFFFLSFFLFI